MPRGLPEAGMGGFGIDRYTIVLALVNRYTRTEPIVVVDLRASVMWMVVGGGDAWGGTRALWCECRWGGGGG